MQIRKCCESEIARTGAFYDSVVKWLDEHVNYPEWMYRIYPSEEFARERTEAGEMYICVEDGRASRHDTLPHEPARISAARDGAVSGGERIIGAFALGTDPMENEKYVKWQQDLPVGTFLIVHALAIDPAYHGQGIGTEVIHFAVRKAKKEDYRALRVEIVTINDPAKRLFEKQGFIYAGDIEEEVGPGVVKNFSCYELNW